MHQFFFRAPFVFGLVLVYWYAPLDAEAQPLSKSYERLPNPRREGPALNGEVHISMVFPVRTHHLCPDGAACILGSGVGVWGIVERRWSSGIALGVGYEVWFLGAGGVYELTVLQSLQGRMRYFFLQNKRLHPFLGLGLGLLTIGDGLTRYATIGGALEGTAGIEIELTITLALVLSVSGRMFTTAPFKSPNDNVRRADGFGLDAAVSAQAGFTIFEAP